MFGKKKDKERTTIVEYSGMKELYQEVKDLRLEVENLKDYINKEKFLKYYDKDKAYRVKMVYTYSLGLISYCVTEISGIRVYGDLKQNLLTFNHNDIEYQIKTKRIKIDSSDVYVKIVSIEEIQGDK